MTRWSGTVTLLTKLIGEALLEPDGNRFESETYQTHSRVQTEGEAQRYGMAKPGYCNRPCLAHEDDTTEDVAALAVRNVNTQVMFP